MSDLKEQLREAAGPRVPFDVSGDLRRGHRALRKRRLAIGVGAASCLIGVSGAAYGMSSVDSPGQTRHTADGVSSIAPNNTVGGPELRYFVLPPNPPGWHVVGEHPQYVMVTKDGSGVTSVDSGFVGQLVVMLSDTSQAAAAMPTVAYDGRQFHVNADGPASDDDTASISVAAGDDNWLVVQYPESDFSVSEMVGYLDQVQPTAAARSGLSGGDSRDAKVGPSSGIKIKHIDGSGLLVRAPHS
jgi:hypothetical protein